MTQTKKANVLVTGAGGFIGGFLCERLVIHAVGVDPLFPADKAAAPGIESNALDRMQKELKATTEVLAAGGTYDI